MARGFPSRYIYLPAKTIRVPAWLEGEIRDFVTRREVERFRSEVGAIRAELDALKEPPAPPVAAIAGKTGKAPRGKRRGK